MSRPSKVFEDVECAICGKTFKRYASTVKTCSPECKKQYEDILRAVAYQVKIPAHLVRRKKDVEKRNAKFAKEVEAYNERGLTYGKAMAAKVTVNAPKWVKVRYL